MKLKTKIIFFVLYTIITIAVVYLVISCGKNHENNNDIKNEVIKKEKTIEERYEEMLKLTESQKQTIIKLTAENEKSAQIISDIKKINNNTNLMLSELETSSESINESLTKMKENNKILRNYYNSVNEKLNSLED